MVSRVRDEVSFRHSVLMLHILLLVVGVEMLRKCLCPNCFNFWLTGLGPALELEGLVLLLIHCFIVKCLGLIVIHSINKLSYILNNYFREDEVVPSLLINSCCLFNSFILSSEKLF